jgi:hypothetical protein
MTSLPKNGITLSDTDKMISTFGTAINGLRIMRYTCSSELQFSLPLLEESVTYYSKLI